MANIEVDQKIKVYEIDYKDTTSGDQPTIGVENDRLFGDRVVLIVDGKRYTVIGDDLTKAIRNAENC